jgi:Zn-dependent metalloprotease
MRRVTTGVLCILLMGAAALGPPGASAETGDNDLRLIAVRHSLLGVHQWYEQVFQGRPVIGSFYGRHQDSSGRVVLVQDGRVAIQGDVADQASVSRADAERAARTRTDGVVDRTFLAVLPGSPARLVWAVHVRGAKGTVRVLVDATSGAVLRAESLTRQVDGTGTVFHPNPVAALQDQSLTDQNDADYPAIQPAYVSVTLTDLDGSGFLRGSYARITQAFNGLANEPTLAFHYDRTSDKFEQVQAYHAVTEAQLYIQSLGFTAVNNESQDLLINTISVDNSFYDPAADTITLGRGGVDDGEDEDIVWHELGHAIHDDQVPGFGIGHDAGSIGEGFGDYWAVTMSQPINDGYQVPCVGDWDAVSYTPGPVHCLRRTDTNKTVDDQTGEIHDDGEIWSRALWDINRLLGRDRANTVILEAQFSYSPSTSWEAAARTTVATARALYGRRAAGAVFIAFRGRGIL